MTKQSKMLAHLPAILRDNAEYNTIFSAQASELDTIAALLDKALADQYLDTATITAIKRWEAMLHLRPDTLNETLDQRRSRIRAKLLERLPFTIRTLREKIAAILGDIPFEITTNHNAYQLDLTIQSQKLLEDFYYQQIDDALTVMLPANLTHHLQMLRLLEQATIYLGATVQTGTELRIYPILNDELTADLNMHTVSYYKQGSTITVYPKE